MKKLLTTTAFLSLLYTLVLAQPKNDTEPGSDNTIVYIILGIVVVGALIYFLSTRSKKP